MARVDPNLVVALNPVFILAMTRDPDTLSSFWNPLLVYFPVTRRFVNLGGVMVDVSPEDNGRLMIDLFLITPLWRDYR
jgi:hypothetical protein